MGIGKVVDIVARHGILPVSGVGAMKTKDDEYLRVKQAAAMMGIAPNTMRKWGSDRQDPRVPAPGQHVPALQAVRPGEDDRPDRAVPDAAVPETQATVNTVNAEPARNALQHDNQHPGTAAGNRSPRPRAALGGRLQPEPRPADPLPAARAGERGPGPGTGHARTRSSRSSRSATNCGPSGPHRWSTGWSTTRRSSWSRPSAPTPCWPSSPAACASSRTSSCRCCGRSA